jgi:hypothetical protein
MQAIHTKYIGPTNTRGSRIKATCDAGSVTIPYPHELSDQACHRAAAVALVVKLGSDDPHYGAGLLGGELPNNAGYCFILDNAQAKE